MKKTMQYIMQHDKVIFSSEDGVSIGVLWNNITGKNFKGKDVDGSNLEEKYEQYLEMMKMTSALPSGHIQLYEKVGKMKSEFCVPSSSKMEVYKQELENSGRNIMFKEAVKFSDVFIQDKNGKHSYSLPGNHNLTEKGLEIAKSWHCVQWGNTYHFSVIDWKEGFTAIFIQADQIIASSLFAVIKTDSVPKNEAHEERIVESIKTKVTLETEDNNNFSTAKAVFAACTITNDNILKLPNVKLDRKIYQEVKSILDDNGGTWKGGKTQGFQFGFNPRELFDKLFAGEKVNNKKKFQFFGTPNDLVDMLVARAQIKSTDDVLEPSAGQGAIADKIHDKCRKLDLCELMPENEQILKSKGYKDILWNNFLTLDLEWKYDKIIANPPFSKNQDIDHVKKMYLHLKPKGRLVSIMSTSWKSGSQKKQNEFKEWLKEVNAKVEDIEQGAFKQSGTNIKTLMVTIDKK